MLTPSGVIYLYAFGRVAGKQPALGPEPGRVGPGRAPETTPLRCAVTARLLSVTELTQPGHDCGGHPAFCERYCEQSPGESFSWSSNHPPTPVTAQ